MMIENEKMHQKIRKAKEKLDQKARKPKRKPPGLKTHGFENFSHSGKLVSCGSSIPKLQIL